MSSCCAVEHEKEVFFEKRQYIVTSLIISLVALVLAYFWHQIVGGDKLLLYFNPGWIAVVLCGIPLFASAGENLFKHGKIKTTLLISVALLACVVLELLILTGVATEGGGMHEHTESYLFAAGEVAFLMMIGELLENITVSKSRKGIEKLISLAPQMANIKLGEQFISMPVEFIKVGDIVLVKPFEQITADGKIIKGLTSVNQAAITGESLPADKAEGDLVFAGTWNMSGVIEIEVSAESNNTTVAKMIQLVKDAESKRAPIVRTADKWASYIVPTAISMSVIIFLITFFLMRLEWIDALVRAVTVLVVFCPCSLALATPTAIAAAIGNASGRGVLIKSGQALESLAKVKTVVFDKTGTLTKGDLQVRDFFAEVNAATVLTLALSVEKNSEHPLALAICNYAKVMGAAELEATDLESMPGVGVSANVGGKAVLVARASHFDLTGVYAAKNAEYLAAGYSTSVVGIDGAISGIFAVADTVRDASRRSVSELNDLGISSVMLTGDNKAAAEAVAREVGIDRVESGLLPQQKVERVEQLKSAGRVCMVGDGVNDAPSLAAADCSVAMGAMGSPAALEVADIALMTDAIERVPGLVKLSRKTLSTIHRNIIIGMSVNAVSVVLSLLGLLTPVLGALVHNVSSVFVVASSALLLGNKTLNKN